MVKTRYTADEVIGILIGIAAGGRGGGVNPENPMLGIPSFTDALEADRERQRPKSPPTTSRPPRARSAKEQAYSRAFKRLAPTYKKKNGGWKKDGFKRCVKAAHADCRKEMR